MATNKRFLAWILSGAMLAGSLGSVTANAAEITGGAGITEESGMTEESGTDSPDSEAAEGSPTGDADALPETEAAEAGAGAEGTAPESETGGYQESKASGSDREITGNILSEFNTSFEGADGDGSIYWWNNPSWSQDGLSRKAYGDAEKPAVDCGSYYLEVSPSGDNSKSTAQICHENIAALIQPEKTYEFTYFAKLSREQESGDVELQVSSVSDGWSSVKDATVTFDSEVTLGAEWQKVSGTFQMPAHDAQKQVAIKFVGSSGLSFCIDDLRVAAVKGEAGDYGDNLVKNPYFAEADLSAWEAGMGNAKITSGRVVEPILDGVTTYGVISDRTSNYDCFAQDMTAFIKSGRSYEYSFYVMLDKDDYKNAPEEQREVSFAPYVEVDGKTTYWGSSSSGILDNQCIKQIPAGEWVKFEGSFHPQYNGTADKLVIRILEQGTEYGSGECVKGKYYVTGVSIREVVTPDKEIEWEIQNLKDTISGAEGLGTDAYTGAEISNSQLSDKALMDLVHKHFNAVTFENEMKMDAMFGYQNDTAPTLRKETWTRADGTVMENYEAPTFDFSLADKMLDAIKAWNDEHPDNIIKVRGHVLVWHSQAPEWFFHEGWDKNQPDVSAKEMDIRQEWYIKSVLDHFTGENSKYKGMFYGWDVVNEAVSDSRGTYRDETENSSWWRVYQSEDYIINAFRYANRYAPKNIELYYNDYNECVGSKVGGIEKLLTAVKAHENDSTLPTRISGMGMQSHHTVSSPTVNQIRDAAVRYGTIVGKVQLTELDLKASDDFDGTDATLASEYTKQAYRYKEIYDVMREVDAMPGIDVNGITVWGVIDKYSWLQSSNSAGGGADGSKRQVPLLFDDDYRAKPAFYAFVDPGKLEPFINNITVMQAAEGNPYANGKTYRIQGTDAAFIPVWTEAGLKVQVTVSDATKDQSDGVKLYVDWEKSMSEDAVIICEELARTECRATEGGYVAEFEIPKELLPAAGFGMDVVVTNDGKSYAFNDLTMTQAASSKYYASAITKPYMEIRKADGAITVDGKADAAWEKAANVQLGVRTGAAKATVSAKLLWDEQYLYVLADVEDSVLDGTSSAAHEQDSLEVFIDENNHKSDSYEEDDKQYRVSYTNAQSFNGPKCTAENITSAAAATDKGYRVEAAYRWTDLTPAVGTEIGIDLQINDAEGGTRIGTVSWYDESGMGWSSPSVFGTAALIGGEEKQDLSGASVTLSQSSYTYDGTAKTPAVTVKVKDTVLVPDRDYTVSYSNNTKVGTASVTVTGTGAYTGSKTVTFTIVSAGSTGGPTDEPSNRPSNAPSTGSTGTVPGGNTDDGQTVTVKPDGGRIVTTVRTNSDGSKVVTTVETDAAGTVIRTSETTTAADGSAKEVVHITKKNSAGKNVAVTTTTKLDADGRTVSATEKSVIEKPAKNTTATVTVKTDANGKTTASAAVTKTGSTGKSGTKGTVSSAVVKQITEAAGTSDVLITQKVKNAENQTAFVIRVKAADLVAGETLTVMKENTRTGELTLVNQKQYTVSSAGNVSVTMAKKATYRLLGADEAADVVDGILKTVKLKKSSGSVKAGKTIKVTMSDKLNMANVEKITYSVSDKTLAQVNKNGKVKGLKKGATVTVKAKVTLKNGMSKTVKMKVKIK